MSAPVYQSTVYMLLFSCLFILSCGTNAGENPPDKPVRILSDDDDKLEGVNNAIIPFNGTPVNFAEANNDDPEFRKVVELYEANDHDGYTTAAGKAFDKTDFKSEDQLHGYIVAAYYALGLYESAAIEVLKRDQRRQPWNYAMKFDLFLCMRAFGRRYGNLEYKKLANRLRQSYGPKLVSVFWEVLPRTVLHKMQEGYHCLGTLSYGGGGDEEGENVLPQMILEYPDDPFLDHALYYARRSEEALEKFPNSIIRDLLIYDVAYDQIELFWGEESKRMREAAGEDYYALGSTMLRKMMVHIDFTKEFKPEVAKAKKLFKTYVEDYPEMDHADDCAFFLAYLFAHEKEYDDAIFWLKKARKVGNKDYSQYYNFVGNLERLLLPYLNRTQKENLLREGDVADSYGQNKIKMSLALKLPYAEAIDYFDQPENAALQQQGFLALSKREFSNFQFDNAKSVLQIALAKGAPENNNYAFIANHIDLAHRVDPNDKPRLYSKVVSGLKNGYLDRDAAFEFIDQSIEKIGSQEDLSALLYLKAVMVRDSNPYAVKSIVEELIRLYPNSSLADDALAELIYVIAMVQQSPSKAEETATFLFHKYPDGNACDNALNWIAMAYRKCCNAYYHCEAGMEKSTACQKSKDYYQHIINNYPLTRFAGYAAENLAKLQ